MLSGYPDTRTNRVCVPEKRVLGDGYGYVVPEEISGMCTRLPREPDGAQVYPRIAISPCVRFASMPFVVCGDGKSIVRVVKGMFSYVNALRFATRQGGSVQQYVVVND